MDAFSSNLKVALQQAYSLRPAWLTLVIHGRMLCHQQGDLCPTDSFKWEFL